MAAVAKERRRRVDGKERRREEEARGDERKGERGSYESFERGRSGEGGKPINFTMANSETVATPFLQFTEVIKV